MGQVTNNISIYIPAAGETNYDAAFAAGMINIDQHDHSGPPTKGVPISTTGFADGSVTYPKLNANVADNTTGIGTSGVNLNQLVLLGILSSIFNISTSAGFIAKNGTSASAFTITGTANQINVASGDGTSGNPIISLPNTFFNAGTFTPTMQTTNSDIGTVAYTSQTGIFQRIGNWLFIQVSVQFTCAGTGTGLLQIQGLPMNAVGTNWISGYANGADLTPNQQVINYTPIATTSNIRMLINGAGGTEYPANTMGANFQLSGVYRIA